MTTASETLIQSPVHIGIWTNWSRGRVLGATLTVDRQDADLLIAFIAFFISFVASRVWRIFCFVSHRLYSTVEPQGAIHHQHQAILRNSSSGEDGLRLLISLLWANRRSKLHLRPLSTAVVAIFCLVAFTVAGGYSSRVSTTVGNEVIIKSANCGYRSPNSFPLQSAAANAYWGDRINNAASYAEQCYSTDSNETNAGLLACGHLTMDRIARNIDTQAVCPFNETICREKSKNLRIDSGLMDSHIHFGFNAPAHQRLLWRKVLHCAPMVTEDYTSLYTSQTINKSLDGSTLYHYGSFRFRESVDYMFLARSIQSQYDLIQSNDTVLSYSNFDLQINPITIENGTASPGSFVPIDMISRQDADIFVLFLLGNGVLYSQPSDDAWYRVDRSTAAADYQIYGVDDISTAHSFLPLEPASPLGCTAQYQFCNAGSGECGPLASQRDAIAGAAPYFDTNYADFNADNARTESAARFIYFVKSAVMPNAPDMGELLFHMGPKSLLSQKHLLDGFQSIIETNQWQRDISHLWDIMMAGHQSALLDAVYGPTNADALVDWVNYTVPGLEKLCNNQKMRSTLYASFSLLGIVFIFLIGALLILVSYVLEPLSSFLHKKGYNQYEHLEWTTNSTLQLQRSAYEALETGIWSNCTRTVPTTKEDALLGSLDISEPEHPFICPRQK
ncbi:hypothetical protein F5Y19DRAFT_468179 [Xylariaceae sp. FL1651]|nr:hypothetical protein F5Y19DRAFT_468179 [Xylariaceae sp. FL1651]